MQEKLVFAAALTASTGGMLAGADWGAIAWAASWAALISFAQTKKDRDAQALAGLKLTPISAILPEVILGTALGLGLSLGGPEIWPAVLGNLAAVTMLAMLGGYMGGPGWAFLGQLSMRYVSKRSGVSDDGDKAG